MTRPTEPRFASGDDRDDDGPQVDPRHRVAGEHRPTGAGRGAAKRLPKVKPSRLRIIGGELRGRSVVYLGDRLTRPMKDSLRETMFNIVGPAIKGRVVWDLFAGTGVIAIEAFSRGALGAVAIEFNRTFARQIRQSTAALGLEEQHVQVLTGDAFRVGPRRMQELLEDGVEAPWVAFFCPPYAMWHEQTEAMFRLLTRTAELAPAGSLIVTETDKFFDPASLPLSPWDIRPKGNMTLAFHETGVSAVPSKGSAPCSDRA